MSGGKIIALSRSCANEVIARSSLSIIEHRNCQDFHVKRARGKLYRLNNGLHVRCGLRIEDDANPINVWRYFLEDLYPLAAHRKVEAGASSNIAAGMREAIDNALADRINPDHENNRNSAGFLLKYLSFDRAICEDDVR